MATVIKTAAFALLILLGWVWQPNTQPQQKGTYNAAVSAGTNATNYSNKLAEYFDPNWATRKWWDDGLAEVALYNAERTVYGKVRRFEYAFVLVKETFNQAYKVKTDYYDREDLYDVMKVNKFARIETDNYPYHYMTSVFMHRNAFNKVHKFTNSSQEWCGTTFKEIMEGKNGYDFTYHSYWDGQGTGQTQLAANLLFEDQLSASLRALKFKDGLSFTYNVLGSQVNSQVRKPQIYAKAKFKVKDTGTNWQVTVQLNNQKTNTYTFAKEYPNLMQSQTTWDDQNLTLKSVKRWAYWQRG